MLNFRYFVIAENHKIDTEALFFKTLKIPTLKLDLWVTSHFSQKNSFQRITDLTESNFQIWLRGKNLELINFYAYTWENVANSKAFRL